MLNLSSVLPPSPNNVLLIISPWLPCLRGWVLCPGPLMGICDAPKRLLKWPTGELRGASCGASSFDVPGSGEAGCTLPCLHWSFSSTAALLAWKTLPSNLDWLARWPDWLIYSPRWLLPSKWQHLALIASLVGHELISAWWCCRYHYALNGVFLSDNTSRAPYESFVQKILMILIFLFFCCRTAAKKNP